MPLSSPPPWYYTERDCTAVVDEANSWPVMVLNYPNAEEQRFVLTPEGALHLAKQLAFAASASFGDTPAVEVRLSDDTLLKLAEILKGMRDGGG